MDKQTAPWTTRPEYEEHYGDLEGTAEEGPRLLPIDPRESSACDHASTYLQPLVSSDPPGADSLDPLYNHDPGPHPRGPLMSLSQHTLRRSSPPSSPYGRESQQGRFDQLGTKPSHDRGKKPSPTRPEFLRVEDCGKAMAANEFSEIETLRRGMVAFDSGTTNDVKKALRQG